jgi:hypothetical protein
MRVVIYAKAFGLAACLSAAAQPAPPDQPSATERPPGKAQLQPLETAPGMKVYVDPQTGAFLKEPPQGAAPPELSPVERNAFSTSHQGLVEEQNPAPGGGVRLNLQGRFQSPLTVTVGPDGKVTMEHRSLDAPANDKR